MNNSDCYTLRLSLYLAETDIGWFLVTWPWLKLNVSQSWHIWVFIPCLGYNSMCSKHDGKSCSRRQKKQSASFHFCEKNTALAESRFHLEKLKYLQDQETNNIYLRKLTTHTTKEYHFSECSMDLLRPCKYWKVYHKWQTDPGVDLCLKKGLLFQHCT